MLRNFSECPEPAVRIKDRTGLPNRNFAAPLWVRDNQRGFRKEAQTQAGLDLCSRPLRRLEPTGIPVPYKQLGVFSARPRPLGGICAGDVLLSSDSEPFGMAIAFTYKTLFRLHEKPIPYIRSFLIRPGPEHCTVHPTEGVSAHPLPEDDNPSSALVLDAVEVRDAPQTFSVSSILRRKAWSDSPNSNTVVPRRRVGRSGAGHRRDPAQRHRQSESILLARVQSGSRHRLQRHPRRRADEPTRTMLMGKATST